MLAQKPSLLATTGTFVPRRRNSLLGGRAMHHASAAGQKALGNSTGNPVQKFQEEGNLLGTWLMTPAGGGLMVG